MKFELCPKTLVFFTKARLRKNIRSHMFNGSENERHKVFENLYALHRCKILAAREG